MAGNRDWILGTLLDLDATDGEVQAAVKASTEGERLAALAEIENRAAWTEDYVRLLSGRLAHLRERHARPPSSRSTSTGATAAIRRSRRP